MLYDVRNQRGIKLGKFDLPDATKEGSVIMIAGERFKVVAFVKEDKRLYIKPFTKERQPVRGWHQTEIVKKGDRTHGY